MPKKSQKFQTLDFLGETGRVVWKLRPEFFKNRLVWHVWYTICLKLCFYSRILKTFKIWILSEKILEFFKNAKFHGKLSASRNFLMLKGSQTFKIGFFGKKDVFCSQKKLDSCEKMLILPTFQLNASRIVLLLKDSQNIQILTFFGKIDKYLEKKNVLKSLENS